MNNKNKKLLAKTCQSLAQLLESRSIVEYAIGITGNPESRLLSYRRAASAQADKISGFALLCWGLPPDDAVEIEKGVYDYIKSNPKSQAYKKCVTRISKEPHRPSVNRKYDKHYLYMVW